jgi:hypothetical protein
MAELQQEKYQFPDEIETNKVTIDAQVPDFEVEIEDDTPPEDRGRFPASPETVKKLEVEVNELDQYSEDAKKKLIQMKRIWNDERRRAESAEREREVAIGATKKLLEENKRIKQMLTTGEQEYVSAVKNTSEMQLEMAKKAYKEAYDMGDSDKLADAQQAMVRASLNLDKANNFKLPTLQEDNYDVKIQHNDPVTPIPDDRVMEWQTENPWFGQDEEMTASALGLHEKLKRQGVKIGSEEYYAQLDKTMRKRFPENFEEAEVEAEPKDEPKAKPKSIVAPATRSTAPKKVKLTTTQVALAKKLGLTPEQYVRELLKLEA